MKLVRYGEPGKERPGVWVDEANGGPGILDVRAAAPEIGDYDGAFFSDSGLARVRELAGEPGRRLMPTDGVRLGPPIVRPSKIMCLGKNYADHVKEFGLEMPEVPVIFTKATTSINGPYDPIVLPRESKVVDLEVELAFVVGKTARRVKKEAALDYIAGYTILNDTSDREVQMRGEQWFCGKSPDTFCPIGPWLVTSDEVPDAHKLRLYSKINGFTLQESNTAQMVFSVPDILAYTSRLMTLLPGDIIATGTPAGCGSVRKEPIVLKEGDHIELGVEALGVQANRILRETEEQP
ncbi:MAG: fumarylacetoacetate hydrolase family protein [Kiritimatiellae bacterium]|nr:fumarylacetoacetate hydrolase family protein [Kiritimatiellia bacterium]